MARKSKGSTNKQRSARCSDAQAVPACVPATVPSFSPLTNRIESQRHHILHQRPLGMVTPQPQRPRDGDDDAHDDHEQDHTGAPQDVAGLFGTLAVRRGRRRGEGGEGGETRGKRNEEHSQPLQQFARACQRCVASVAALVLTRSPPRWWWGPHNTVCVASDQSSSS